MRQFVVEHLLAPEMFFFPLLLFLSSSFSSFPSTLGQCQVRDCVESVGQADCTNGAVNSTH